MPAHVTKDEQDKFRSAAADSIRLRAGRLKKSDARPGALDLRGFRMVELAREALRFEGRPTGGNSIEVVGRALAHESYGERSMVTTDFAAILSNVANKELFEGYETQQETWRTWCDIGGVSDFKTNTLTKASEVDDLDEIAEDDEYKHGKLTDDKETLKLATYGKIFRISRQAIINDDLGVFTELPFKHGEAAARKVGDIVYSVLTSNLAMNDGNPLFDAAHSNIGTGGLPSETTIAEGIMLMGLQKDLQGISNLNIRAQYFISPLALEGAAETFFNSGQFAGDNKAATRANPYAGTRFTRVYDPRLDGDSSKKWYLAGPKGKTIKVFFLDGIEEPYLEKKEAWSADGTEFKVRIDAAAKAIDHRALVKNEGPAS